MSPTLDPQLRRALADRVRYYTDLGIYDFYRRAVTTEIVASNSAAPAFSSIAVVEEEHLSKPKAKSAVADPRSGLRLIREDIYIANIIKCRPPGNRTPERDECETCSPFLMRQIEVIGPKAIVALGAVAAKTLLAVNAPMSELRGRWYDFRGTKLAVTYHPAFLLRDPRQKKEAWKDLQMVMKELGMEAPPKTSE